MQPSKSWDCAARHGRFWLRGLPLSAGTNAFILRAVDAWTNTLVTNLTLVRGALTVTVDPPGGDLWGGTVPVSGTVSGTNGAVWVNGQPVTATGTNWSGVVPIGGGGVGVVTVAVYPLKIEVAGRAGLIHDMEVILRNLRHQRPDDLDILLVSPTGKKIMLMSDAGGSTPVNNLTLVFKPYAAVTPPDEGDLGSDVTRQYQHSNYGETETVFPNAAAPADSPPGGPYQDRLTDLLWTDSPNGSWRLYIVDDSPTRSGFLLGSWCLNIQTTE